MTIEPRKKPESEYEKQAREFAEKIGLTMEANYLGHYPRLGDTSTAVYQILLKRKGREYRFEFSTSLNDSWVWQEGYPGRTGYKSGKGAPSNMKSEHWYKIKSDGQTLGRWIFKKTKKTPTIYDILACITKNDPGSFYDFCADFGYSDDSISAEKTYRSVVEEWREVDRMFHDVLDELQEIN